VVVAVEKEKRPKNKHGKNYDDYYLLSIKLSKIIKFFVDITKFMFL
jgi:hypothetical protein